MTLKVHYPYTHIVKLLCCHLPNNDYSGWTHFPIVPWDIRLMTNDQNEFPRFD